MAEELRKAGIEADKKFDSAVNEMNKEVRNLIKDVDKDSKPKGFFNKLVEKLF